MSTDRKTNSDISPWEAMGLVWDLLITVIVMTGLFAFVGVYLDRIAHTKFIFTVLSFIGLIFIGKKILTKKSKKIIERMNEGTKKTPQS